MRVLLSKVFGRFQRRERIADAALCEAVGRAERGLVDADLGRGLIKQRVARPGEGRRGGYRTVIAYRAGERAVFLTGFAKSARANLDDDELAALQAIGAAWLKGNEAAIEAAIADDRLREVYCDEED